MIGQESILPRSKANPKSTSVRFAFDGNRHRSLSFIAPADVVDWRELTLMERL
jgi:hypothetical protein